MLSFVCQICYESHNERLQLQKYETRNGDVLRAEDCGHPICQTCLGRYITVRVEEQRVSQLRCPYDGCTVELYAHDLQKLVEIGALRREVSSMCVELRTRDYTERARALADAFQTARSAEDIEYAHRLWQTTRLCPRCSLIIERSHGCNSFYCICGHHFNYASAPRVVGNGISKFNWVLQLAKTHGVSLGEAAKFHGDQRAYKRVGRLASLAHIAIDAALELDTRARSGDEVARKQIRKIRQSPHAMSEAISYGFQQLVDFEALAIVGRLGSLTGLERFQVGKLPSAPKLTRHLTWPQSTSVLVHCLDAALQAKVPGGSGFAQDSLLTNRIAVAKAECW